MNITVKWSLAKSTFKILSGILSQNHFLKYSFIFNVSSISWLSTTKFGCKSSCSYFSSLHSTGTNVIFENLVWGWFEDIRFGVTKIFANYAIIMENMFDLMIKSQASEPSRGPTTRSGVKVRSNHSKHLKNVFVVSKIFDIVWSAITRFVGFIFFIFLEQL